ncbi:MAG: ATP phosphoribosyltransferase regulatory subunit [Proteobacteria bacterium]|nr:ATP phosphoribosyltransferase regulatory subunit [Pseudomonadota bacterium]
MKTPPAISLPQGVRDILPAESARINSIEEAVLNVFSNYGFERVITPMLEYLDVLSLGLDKNLKDKVVKFIEPATGRVICMRPDITPQIARVAATRMKDTPRPLKLCYNESIIRLDTAGSTKTTEILQLGAEYLSEEPSPEIDAEMVIMALESFKALNIKDYKIDLGDVGFIRAILDRLKLSIDERAKIKNAIAIKDTSGLEAALDEMGESIPDSSRELLIALTTLYGEEEVIETALKFKGLSKAAKAALKNLKTMLKIIEKKGYKDLVTVDLGEVRGFDYYTGIIFEGFADGVGKPILYGGRYDNLHGLYGLPSASTGFAFDEARLLQAINNS